MKAKLMAFLKKLSRSFIDLCRFVHPHGFYFVSFWLVFLCIKHIVDILANIKVTPSFDLEFISKNFDLMYISGVGAFIFAGILVRSLPRRFDEVIVRLSNRQVIVLDKDIKDLDDKIDRKANIWASSFGFLTGIIVFIFWIREFGLNNEVIIPTSLAGYIAGRYFGRMSCYGFLNKIFETEKVKLEIKPEHVDNTCGLKPLGDFYFFQAIIMMIPAIFLAGWLIAIPAYCIPIDKTLDQKISCEATLDPAQQVLIQQVLNLPLGKKYPHYKDYIFSGNYLSWRYPFLFLLAFVLIVENLSFIIPLYSFHNQMVKQKNDHIAEADELSITIAKLQEELYSAKEIQERKELEEQINYSHKKIVNIENMPTWPIDSQILKRFSVSNLSLSIPLINHFFGNAFGGIIKSLLIPK